MILLQISAAEVIVWRDIILPILYVGGVIYGTIILSRQVTVLKEQVNSQKEILSNSKAYSEILDLNKIREYAKLTEENAKLKSNKKLDELNKKITEKGDELTKVQSEFNQKIQDAQQELATLTTQAQEKQEQINLLTQTIDELNLKVSASEQKALSAESGLTFVSNRHSSDLSAFHTFGLAPAFADRYIGDSFSFVASYILVNNLSPEQMPIFFNRHFPMSSHEVLNYMKTNSRWQELMKNTWRAELNPDDESVTDLLVSKWSLSDEA